MYQTIYIPNERVHGHEICFYYTENGFSYPQDGEF